MLRSTVAIVLIALGLAGCAGQPRPVDGFPFHCDRNGDYEERTACH
jgi:hypothetical protein